MDIAGHYNNIGVVYQYMGNYPEALKNYFAALKIFEEIGDKKGIANCLYQHRTYLYINKQFP